MKSNCCFAPRFKSGSSEYEICSRCNKYYDFTNNNDSNITIPQFPQNPSYGQIHGDYTYINGTWVKKYDDAQFQLIRLATKQGIEDYETQKELLKRTATQCMIEDGIQRRIEQAHKEQKELVEAVEYVLSNFIFGKKGESKYYQALLNFLLRNKPNP